MPVSAPAPAPRARAEVAEAAPPSRTHSATKEAAHPAGAHASELAGHPVDSWNVQPLMTRLTLPHVLFPWRNVRLVRDATEPTAASSAGRALPMTRGSSQALLRGMTRDASDVSTTGAALYITAASAEQLLSQQTRTRGGQGRRDPEADHQRGCLQYLLDYDFIEMESSPFQGEDRLSSTPALPSQAPATAGPHATEREGSGGSGADSDSRPGSANSGGGDRYIGIAGDDEEEGDMTWNIAAMRPPSDDEDEEEGSALPPPPKRIRLGEASPARPRIALAGAAALLHPAPLITHPLSVLQANEAAQLRALHQDTVPAFLAVYETFPTVTYALKKIHINQLAQEVFGITQGELDLRVDLGQPWRWLHPRNSLPRAVTALDARRTAALQTSTSGYYLRREISPDAPPVVIAELEAVLSRRQGMHPPSSGPADPIPPPPGSAPSMARSRTGESVSSSSISYCPPPLNDDEMGEGALELLEDWSAYCVFFAVEGTTYEYNNRVLHTSMTRFTSVQFLSERDGGGMCDDDAVLHPIHLDIAEARMVDFDAAVSLAAIGGNPR